jgi:hypothetical protein
VNYAGGNSPGEWGLSSRRSLFFPFDGPGSKCGAMAECAALVCGGL